jgi:hypothetical protein
MAPVLVDALYKVQTGSYARSKINENIRKI